MPSALLTKALQEEQRKIAAGTHARCPFCRTVKQLFQLENGKFPLHYQIMSVDPDEVCKGSGRKAGVVAPVITMRRKS